VGDRNAEALRGFGGRVLLEPARRVARPCHHEYLVGRELAQSVLDRLHGVGIADLGLDCARLGLHRALGALGDLRGLPPSGVLVRGKPLEGRKVGRRRDDPHLRRFACVLVHALAQDVPLDRDSRHDQQAPRAHLQPIPDRGRKKNGAAPKPVSMRPLLRALLTATALALTVASPSGAVLDGTPDAAHPYVGILVTEIDGDLVPVCSGFLVSPTVFVTAGHCVEDLGGVLPAFVSFDQAFTSASQLHAGTAVPNPRFGSAGPNSHDVALVLLDDPVTNLGFAQLPGPDRLASVPRGSALTVVGYGANARHGHNLKFNFARTFGEARLVKAEKKTAHLRMSTGVCFGDSGGPTLLGASNLALAVNSFVSNRQCAGNSFAYRLDTAEAMAFLAPYL
jgi:Trypsin